MNLGILYRKTGELEKSEQALRAAVQRDAGDAEGWNELGVTLRHARKIPGCRRGLQPRHRCRSELCAGVSELGDLLDLYQGDAPGALTAMQHYKELTGTRRPSPAGLPSSSSVPARTDHRRRRTRRRRHLPRREMRNEQSNLVVGTSSRACDRPRCGAAADGDGFQEGGHRAGGEHLGPICRCAKANGGAKANEPTGGHAALGHGFFARGRRRRLIPPRLVPQPKAVATHTIASSWIPPRSLATSELPKVMYMVPWKHSDLGDMIGKPVEQPAR